MPTVEKANVYYEEVVPPSKPGMPILLLNTLLMVGSVVLFVYGVIFLSAGNNLAPGLIMLIASLVYLLVVGPIMYFGLRIVRPNEAIVLTLLGKYYGSLRQEGFYFVNPFASPTNPTATAQGLTSGALPTGADKVQASVTVPRKVVSLKQSTLNNDKQKINDRLGNPIIIGVVVIWRVVNTAQAVFNVDNYKEFLSIQCDAALRNTVRNYAYDTPNEDSEMSLRGSSQEVAERLREELQSKVRDAGLEVCEARITHLSYAPEIAGAMLQRQQASAIVDARQMIVEGAVGMVEMALAKLNENDIVKLDEERKAAMVSNLLVVLCGNRDVQPVVNSGSIY